MRLALLFVLPLAGCVLFTSTPLPDTGDPYGIKNPNGNGGNPDNTTNDGHVDFDTGIAFFYYYGDGKTTDGAWESGHFGNIWYGAFGQGNVCDVVGDWAKSGPPEGGCPGCEWAFTLIVEDTLATGTQCDDLAAIGAVDGAWDRLEYGFAWTDELAFNYYGDVVYLDSVILLFYDGDWAPFVFNYGSYQAVQGTAEDFSFLTYRTEYHSYYR